MQLQIYFSKFPQIIIIAPSLLHLIALCELLSPAYFSTPRPNQKFPVSAWRSAARSLGGPRRLGRKFRRIIVYPHHLHQSPVDFAVSSSQQRTKNPARWHTPTLQRSGAFVLFVFVLRLFYFPLIRSRSVERESNALYIIIHNPGNVCLWVRGVLEAAVHLEGEHLQGGVMKLKYFLQIKNIFSSTRWCGATSCCTSSSTPPSPPPTDIFSLMSRRWPRYL